MLRWEDQRAGGQLESCCPEGLLVKRYGTVEGCLVRGELGDSFADGWMGFSL